MFEAHLGSASSYAGQIDGLILLITVLVGFWLVLSEVVFFGLIFRYRRRDGVKADYITGEEKEIKRWIGPNFLPQAMMLMSVDPKRYEDQLLELFVDRETRTSDTCFWLAAGNMLANTRSSRFVARILDDVNISIGFSLVDPGTTIRGRRLRLTGKWGTTADCGYDYLEGYPPYGYYNLTLDKTRPGSKLLGPGPHDVFFQRHTKARGDGSYPSSGRGCHKDQARLAWVAEMLGTTPRGLPIKASSWEKLEFTNLANYHRDLVRAEYIAVGGVRGLTNRLHVVGMLSKEQVKSIRPSVSIRVSDERAKPVPKLPQMSWITVTR